MVNVNPHFCYDDDDINYETKAQENDINCWELIIT